MKSTFVWFDQNPWGYAMIALTATVIVVFALLRSIARPDDEGRAGSGVGELMRWIVLFTLLLFAWRWPVLLDPRPLNPDEAVFVAGAIKLEHDPLFWRSLESTTSGPLVSMPLLVLRPFGLPLDYFNARMVALLFAAASMGLALQTMRRLAGSPAAVVAISVPLAYLVFTREDDLLHYSSEHLPVTLLSLAVWLVVQARDSGCRGAAWLSAGVCLGLAPWAKLQSSPIAASLGFWALMLVLLRPELARDVRLKRSLALLGAALSPSAVLLIGYAATGQLRHWWSSYIVNNLAYDAGQTAWDGLRFLHHLASFTYGLHACLAFGLILVLAGWVRFLQVWREAGFWLGMLGLGSAVYAVVAPGRGFLHYALLALLPLAWAGAAGIQPWLATGSRRRSKLWPVPAFMLTVFCVQFIIRAPRLHPEMVGQLASAWRFPRTEIGEVLHRLREPGDTMGVWGWNADLFVQAGLPSATRESQTERQIRPGPQRDAYYRPRYLAELRQNAPTLFVDVVGQGAFPFNDRASEAHEADSALTAYLDAHYVFVADFHPSRLYLRRDRSNDLDALRFAFEHAAAHRPPIASHEEPWPEITTLPDRPQRTLGALQVSMMETPARSELTLAGDERMVWFSIGYDPRAYERPDQGNGCVFSLSLETASGEETSLWRRHLDPAGEPKDRGPQRIRVHLPPISRGAQLIIATDPGPHGDASWDWAYVRDIRFLRGPRLNEELFDPMNASAP